MQPRAFLGLLVVTLLAIVAAAVVLATGPGGGRAGAGGDPAFPRLRADATEAAEIAIAGAAGTVRLRRGAEGVWMLPDKGGFPADPLQVRQLLLDAGKLRLAEPKTDNPARLHRLWLEDPAAPGAQSLRLTVTADDGALLADAIVGRTTNDLVAQQEGGTYLRYPAEARAWLAAGRLSLSPDPLDYLDRGLVNLPADSIRRVVVTRADGGVILAERARGEPALAVKTGLGEGQAADPKALASLANLLDGLVFADVAPAEAVAFPPDATHVTVTSFDGIEVRLELAVVDSVPWARLTAVLAEEHGEDPERLQGTQAFIGALAARTAGWAFRLAPAAYERLAPTAESLTRAP
jgi:hypothetical protein